MNRPKTESHKVAAANTQVRSLPPLRGFDHAFNVFHELTLMATRWRSFAAGNCSHADLMGGKNSQMIVEAFLH